MKCVAEPLYKKTIRDGIAFLVLGRKAVPQISYLFDAVPKRNLRRASREV